MECRYLEVNISMHGTNIIEDFKLIKYYVSIIKEIKTYFVLIYTIKP